MNRIIWAYIRLTDEPEKCYDIKNCSEVAYEIINLKLDDRLNIRGLGRLLVRDIGYEAYPSELSGDEVYYIYNIMCEWLCDAFNALEEI